MHRGEITGTDTVLRRAPHRIHTRVTSAHRTLLIRVCPPPPPPPWQLFPRNADELLEELLLSTFGFQIFLMEGKHEVSSSSLIDDRDL